MIIPALPKSKMRPITAGQCKAWREFCAERVSRHFREIVPEYRLKADLGTYREYAHWRFYAMAIMSAHGLSLPRIAKVLGLKDHTAVLYGLRRAHGYDGNWKANRHKPEPLWTKEHFEKIALADQQETQGKKWRAA